MKTKILIFLTTVSAVILIGFACTKDSKPVTKPNYSYTEEFDTVANALKRGWVIANNSKPIGTVSWKQGVYYYENKKGTADGFEALSGNYSGTDFIMTTYDCGAEIANCSNWLITPEMTVKNGDVFSFYTRTYQDPADYADRLEVRMNTVNSSADVGIDSNSVGNFNKLLLQINPNLIKTGVGAYPGEWKQYSITIDGFPAPQKTRIAFRYYVPNSGPNGSNGTGIGLDKVEFTAH